MFIPNLIGKLAKRTGYDVYGRSVTSDPVMCRFSDISLALLSQSTALGANSSGSQGSSKETISNQAKILVSPNTEISIGDIFSFNDDAFEVIGIQPRHSVMGRLDHYEIFLTIGKRK